jgi:membrane-bound inhibitor of C-type lysozyme
LIGRARRAAKSDHMPISGVPNARSHALAKACVRRLRLRAAPLRTTPTTKTPEMPLQKTPAPLLRRALLPALALAALAAHGDEPTLTFPKTTVASASVREYACEHHEAVSVAYVATADGDALAYFIADGRPHIFVRVLAESGSRFVSGPYVWSTLGTSATLTRSDDPSAAPLLSGCVIVATPGAPAPNRVGTDAR